VYPAGRNKESETYMKAETIRKKRPYPSARSASAPGRSGRPGAMSSEADGKAALNAALDAGMTFIDTADVYGDGRSETIIREVLKARSGPRPFVATKAGRRLNPHNDAGYTKKTWKPSSTAA